MSGVRQVRGSGADALDVLCGIDLDIPHGDYVAVTGPPVGPGKAALSALYGVLGCLEPPAEGEYRLDGVDVTGLEDRKLALVRNRAVGFVFQTPGLMPRTSAFENVELPLAYAKVERSMRRRRAQAALGLVELTGLGENRADRMPVIEQTRVAIARALVTTPCLIIADEPTGELDAKSGSLIMELFDRLNGTGRTIVLMTRDETVAAHAKRIIRLSDGVIAEDKRIAEIDAPPPLAAALLLPKSEPEPELQPDAEQDIETDSDSGRGAGPDIGADMTARARFAGKSRRRRDARGAGTGGKHAGPPEPEFDSAEFDISLPAQLTAGPEPGRQADPTRTSEAGAAALSDKVGG
jgi:putative ABC transport system ATP-binding protein